MAGGSPGEREPPSSLPERAPAGPPGDRATLRPSTSARAIGEREGLAPSPPPSQESFPLSRARERGPAGEGTRDEPEATYPTPERTGSPPADQPAETALAREQRAFAYAFQGLSHAWRTQPHLRIHAGIGSLAVVAAAAFRLSPAEWAVLLLTITAVLVLELLNTVVEAVVDLASPDYHPLAKVAKDVAAAAVLVAAIGSVFVGAALFLPRLWRLLLG